MAGGIHEDSELQGLQSRVQAKRAHCQQLREQVAAVHADKDAAKNACMSGVEAAKVQMGRLREEVSAMRANHGQSQPLSGAATSAEQSQEASHASSLVPHEREGVVAVHSGTPAVAPRETDEERGRRDGLQLQARTLRHELSKWKHQAELLEAQRPQQEQEIITLKAKLTHFTDVLDSTRNTVRHHDVEQKLRDVVPISLPNDERESGYRLPLQGGGHGSVEAKAERIVRERTEERNGGLSSKAKRLMGVVGAQQLLIQRLEKQLLKEESALEQKEMQLAHETNSHTNLKGALRKRSNFVVAAALGVPGARSSSVPPGMSQDHSSANISTTSVSASQLPSI